MTRTRKRDRAGGQTGANPETNFENCPDSNRIPADTPEHVRRAWRRWNREIDKALDAGMPPWALAELAACSIAGEWAP